MENEFSLFDELIDSPVINCDVEFGSPVVSTFVSKQSPSHESDSGCSDMSEVRSVSPLSEVDFMSEGDQVKLFDFDSVAGMEFDEATSDLDKELASYLAVPKSCSREDGTSLKTPTPPVVVRPSVNPSSNTGAASPEIDVGEDSESDPDDPDYMPGKVVQAQALKTRPKPCIAANVINIPVAKDIQTDIHVLPSSSRVSTIASKGCKATSILPTAPAVKVVKVVKTSAKSKRDIDNELIHALDERNKKNAQQAKMNREKKKAYVKSLEDEIEQLKCENFSLRENNRKVNNDKEELLEEVEYLKSVLANQSVLSGLLRNISNVDNVKLSTSVNRKRDADLDHDYHSAAKRVKLSTKKTAGVCLHVDQGNVSLEFCSKCASMANTDSSKTNS